MTEHEASALNKLTGEIGEMRGQITYFLNEIAPHLMTKSQCDERHGLHPGRMERLEAGKQREYGSRKYLVGMVAGIGLCITLIGVLVTLVVNGG